MQTRQVLIRRSVAPALQPSSGAARPLRIKSESPAFGGFPKSVFHYFEIMLLRPGAVAPVANLFMWKPGPDFIRPLPQQFYFPVFLSITFTGAPMLRSTAACMALENTSGCGEGDAGRPALFRRVAGEAGFV
jgi:hypothetical protein